MIRNLPQGHPNGTWTFYDWQSSRQSIPDRFAEVACQFPDRPATYDTARQLTYVELERAANGAAHAILEARGPNQEAVIILTGINTTATIAALGVLKANKFYVGLDPTFPAVRAGQIIQDTEARLILTETLHLPLARTLAGGECRIIDLDTLPAGDDRKPDTTVPVESIAIINYTSGSTGQPKGVVHTHRSALAQAVRYGNAYRLSDVDRMTNFGSLAWAGSFWDTFGPLCLGACVASYKDFQVKIRGYQVPTHEVESRLLDIEGVRDVCVAARSLSDGSQELVAYLVADQDHSLTVERLRSRLVDRLPDHMVPHRFIHMDRLPRTLNGKVDRHALPGRNSERPRLETEHVAPRTPFEAALGTIWSEVLGIDRVGIHDDFLSLGGDSLRAAQVLSRVEHEFGVALSFELLLMGPTVADLAIAITDRMMAHLPPEQIEAYLAGDTLATPESEPRRSRPAEQKQPGGSEGGFESGRSDS